MRALKILVVVLGVLLALGTAALVAAIIYRVQHGPLRTLIVPPRSETPGKIVAELPPSAHIEGIELAGDRIVVRVALPSGEEELILFDARNGKQVATIEFRLAVPRADSRP